MLLWAESPFISVIEQVEREFASDTLEIFIKASVLWTFEKDELFLIFYSVTFS